METIAFLFAAGAVLLLLEPLFPHFIAGPIGLFCWAVALVMIYSRYGFAMGNWSLVAVLTVALVGAWWYLKHLPTTRVGRVVQSDHVVPTETAAKTHLVDQFGISLTPLRPGGMAQFGAERVDVITSGEPVERGQKLRVISVEGTRVLVRAI
ncbi:MAG TPA: NfeD family protein [Verrucomicrobiota bacterium]|nr:hypothetical protein [Verrucomicrobiales bacterium]HRI14135.1 NfeD family protein [Verrucomicrobiota bacterium]